MRPANQTSLVSVSGQKPTPLLASIPIPISRRKAPVPPPSSPIRYHHSTTEDDLLFAMSPDRSFSHTSSTIKSYAEQHTFSSSSTRIQKYLNNYVMPLPFLSVKAEPYPDEPFMYTVPNFKASQRPQTPKKKVSVASTIAVTTPTARRHALLKPSISSTCPPRTSVTCSSSQTSEDEAEFGPYSDRLNPLTSAFSRSMSVATSTTTSTASSSTCSSVDRALTTAASSFPHCLSDDIVLVPTLPLPSGGGKEHIRSAAGFFDEVDGGLPSPSPSHSRDHVDEKHPPYGDDDRVSKLRLSSLGLEKYLREIADGDVRGQKTKKAKPAMDVAPVTRGRARERKIS